MTLFKNYRESIIIKDHIKAKHIIVGDYPYYSYYYQGTAFKDCVMYLDAVDNHTEANGIDQLIIDKFCSIATGVKFMMGGTQGHNYKWIANYPLDFLVKWWNWVLEKIKRHLMLIRSSDVNALWWAHRESI